MESGFFNPWSLPRPELREDEREYIDPRHPDKPVLMRFRQVKDDPIRESQAFALYGQYYEKWVKPKPRGVGQEPQPQMLPAPGGGVVLNEVILDQLVTMEVMQVPPKGQPRYGLIEWAGFAVTMGAAFSEMWRVCRELNDGAPDEGNAVSAESMNTSESESSSPRSSTEAHTPNGFSIPPDPSGASPEASEPFANGSESQMGNAEKTQDESTLVSSATTSV